MKSENSFYPFYQYGSLQPDRAFHAESYRFGFNGQEMDNEVTGGVGNTNTVMFWEYDTRLGRRWNLDPKPTTGISEYACFGNNPIIFGDRFGDTIVVSLSDQAMAFEDISKVFGENANNFSFNSKNQLVFSGDPNAFNGDERTILSGMLIIMNNSEITNIVYKKN